MILVTGVAGFIGFNVAKRLLEAGHRVIGVDCVNHYYDPALKESRLAQLEPHKDFLFYRENIADRAAMESIAKKHSDIGVIVHLAAQAGVRYSIENPYAYAESNLLGQMVMLEMARHAKNLRHFVYASSSSVYGNDSTAPFSTSERCDAPVSLYAATKRSGEMLAHSYSTLYGIPSTGLRFFTVYGPWGRPDMAYYSFTKAICEGAPIKVFNNGDLRRDFTFIDDIAEGIIRSIGAVPAAGAPHTHGGAAHRIFNLGNHNPVRLMDFIQTIETALGKKAVLEMAPMAAGDVYETYADISAAHEVLGFTPHTSLDEGIRQFTAWYRGYFSV